MCLYGRALEAKRKVQNLTYLPVNCEVATRKTEMGGR